MGPKYPRDWDHTQGDWKVQRGARIKPTAASIALEYMIDQLEREGWVVVAYEPHRLTATLITVHRPHLETSSATERQLYVGRDDRVRWRDVEHEG